MSTRRSGRAKAPVKYTSDSEGSDFGAKKSKKVVNKKGGATPKKSAKREAKAEPAATTPKRRKKDPEVLAAELQKKAEKQEAKAEKAQHKKDWESWLEKHDLSGRLLESEPDREESITQTDSQKKYGLKPGELGSLLHFEKRNPNYGNTMKIFLEEDVKKLAFRKYGILAGITDESQILEKGEELWKEGHSDDLKPSPPPKEQAKPEREKTKTPKQKWADYINEHSLSSTTFPLTVEPEAAINQTDSKTKYSLTPQDLAVLPYFPKPNPKYGNTTKLFEEGEVKALAYKKAAILEGVEESEDGALAQKGKAIFEKKEKENGDSAE
ncbi:hypothetical protein BKA66DRAFT_564670 [Pyrenochaeta sp. MPI-SDFR-AT-0127]|nr:hypothetical protein BKA66DRAFT_564670 [Pyrenochaeta sp. MPI-SDFR-AT-0127]